MNIKQQVFIEDPLPEGVCSACRMSVGLQNLLPVPLNLLCVGETPAVRICPRCLEQRPFLIQSHRNDISRTLQRQQDFPQQGDQIDIDNLDARQLQRWRNDKPGCTYILSTSAEHVYKIGMTNANLGQRESSFRRMAPGAGFVHALYSDIPGTLEDKLHNLFGFEHDCNPRSTEIVILSPQALAWLRYVQSIKIEIRDLLEGDKEFTYEVKHVHSPAQCNALIKRALSDRE